MKIFLEGKSWKLLFQSDCDGKVTIVARKYDKDDSVRESDSSDQTSDEKDTTNN